MGGVLAALELYREHRSGAAFDFPKKRVATTELRKVTRTAAQKLAKKGRVGATTKRVVKVRKVGRGQDRGEPGEGGEKSPAEADGKGERAGPSRSIPESLLRAGAGAFKL